MGGGWRRVEEGGWRVGGGWWRVEEGGGVRRRVEEELRDGEREVEGEADMLREEERKGGVTSP